MGDDLPDLPIAIIGAGFAGIATAIRLRQEGITSFTIFERADEIGGTWRDNTYPGAACDVPSHVYSLSFAQSPKWTRRYAPSKEIQDYLLGLVEQWQLRSHLRLGTEIVEARFDEAQGTWTLTTGEGEPVRARVVVSGVDDLIDPKLPDIKGIERFEGELFHTARWNHDYDLMGRRVAVVGTGASAVQVVPSIAGEVDKLSVFQRTPAWVVPKQDHRYTPQQIERLERHPWLLRLSRYAKYWLSEVRGPMVYLDSKRLSAIAEKGSKMHLEAQVKDPELRRKLTPDFQFGCKRILISDDYWATFERDNVELVTDPIDSIEARGLRTRDGRLHEVDAIVMATGFALGLAAAPFPIVGRGGVTLDEAWKDGAVAFQGMSVSGFPNWFVLMGPNTGPGHTSVLVFTEAQVSHAIEAIRALRERNLKFVDVKPEVVARWNQKVQGRMGRMVWSTGCNSWYLSDDHSNHSLYPGPAFEYVVRARHFHDADYELAAG